jgi:hypothetical protein
MRLKTFAVAVVGTVSIIPAWVPDRERLLFPPQMTVER